MDVNQALNTILDQALQVTELRIRIRELEQQVDALRNDLSLLRSVPPAGDTPERAPEASHDS